MRIFLLTAMIVASAIFAGGCQTDKMTTVPNGFIRSSDNALEIGKIYLRAVYGDARVETQEPFNVLLEDDIWIVCGKVTGYEEPMKIVLSRSNGQVIYVSPYTTFK